MSQGAGEQMMIEKKQRCTIYYRLVMMMLSSKVMAFSLGRRATVPFRIRSSRLLHPSTVVQSATACPDDFVNQTIPQVLKASLRDFRASNTPEPLQSATQLLAVSLDLPWATGYLDLMRISEKEPATNDTTTTKCADDLESRRLTVDEAVTFSGLVERRKQHEPIQYLAGRWDFLDYVVQVRAPLLCPRPETEELVLLALEDCASASNILDVGCGTGCIGIALADKVPGATVTAIDVEPVAVETAAINAASILGDCANKHFSARLVAASDYNINEEDEMRFDLVVSNPPYIPQSHMTDLDPTVVNFESETALVGGIDGMDVIRTIVCKLPDWCRPGAVCWMEVDPSHPRMLREWLEGSETTVEFVSYHNDMYGRERFVKLKVRDG